MENEGGGAYQGEGGDALIPSLPGTIGGPPISADANIGDWSRGISDNGEFIIFATAERLQASDEKNAVDVYEWHDGTVSMVSDGRQSEGISGKMIALSSSGADIFFTTRTALVGQDTDVLRDVYDARMNRCVDREGIPTSFPEGEEEAAACRSQGGEVELAGFARPEAGPSCSDDACQGPLTTSEPFTPAASSVFTGGQNLTPALTAVMPSREAARKSLTRAQQLAKALNACKRTPRRKRASCESQARKKYGATPKKKAKAKK